MRLKAALIAAAFTAAVPGAAHAATADYAPGANARDFAAGAGGWTGSEAHEGIACLPGVLCPEVANSFVPSGGASGGDDGYIESEFSTVVASLAGTTIGTWESPAFRYKGVAGAKPAKVRFLHTRQSDLTEILGLPSAAADYSVEIVDLADGGATIPVVTDDEVPDAVVWEAMDPVAIGGGALKIGNRYRIRISTAVSTPLAALAVSGAVGYDDVRLRATGPSARKLARGVRVGAAKLAGGKLRVGIKCPKAVAPGKCRVKALALFTKRGPKATKWKKARIKGGKRKTLKLKVKRKFAAFLPFRKKVVVHAKVKAAGERFTVTKRVKLKA